VRELALQEAHVPSSRTAVELDVALADGIHLRFGLLAQTILLDRILRLADQWPILLFDLAEELVHELVFAHAPADFGQRLGDLLARRNRLLPLLAALLLLLSIRFRDCEPDCQGRREHSHQYALHHHPPPRPVSSSTRLQVGHSIPTALHAQAAL
jgi:hypothetical protein